MRWVVTASFQLPLGWLGCVSLFVGFSRLGACLLDQAFEVAPALGPGAAGAFGEHIASVHFDSSFLFWPRVVALCFVFVVR